MLTSNSLSNWSQLQGAVTACVNPCNFSFRRMRKAHTSPILWGRFKCPAPPAHLKNGNSQVVRIPAGLTDERTDSELEIEVSETSFAFAQPAVRSPVCRPSSPSSPWASEPKIVATMGKRKETASGARRSDRELAATCGALTRNKSQTAIAA